MGRIVFHRLLRGVGLIAFLVSYSMAAEVENQLEGIKKKIEKEKQGISRVSQQEGSILQSLEKIEGELDKKNDQLKQINAKLETILAITQKTESELAKIDTALSARRTFFKQRVFALYRWHRGGSPFVILNGGSSLGALMRRKRYLELTLDFDRELVRSLNEESARQEHLKQELAGQRSEVDAQRRRLLAVKDSVRDEADKKKQILANLKREKAARVRALKELEQAAHRLQKMMDEINRRAESQPRETTTGVGFDGMRGKLDLPVRGAVTGGFGKSRHPEFSDELFRKGIDIEARLGDEIRAVEGGKVVFADRFSGYGKMLIIDHGERYYTIYAHLSDLLKKKGEPVQKGDSIGLVGDSDSLAGARLYFEIRKDGRSIDPLPWFRKR